MNKRLVRLRGDRMIAGVCSGIANYFNIDPTVVRLIAVVLFFAGTIGLWTYLIAMLIMPNEC